MRAGELRHRVTIQRRAASYDGRGHETETWSTVATIWARVRELSGRELERARQLAAEATIEVTVRSREILATDRLVYKNRLMQVASVIANEFDTERRCLCSEDRGP